MEISYATYSNVRNYTGFTENEVPNSITTIHISDAEDEIEAQTGQRWDTTSSTTMIFQGPKKDIQDQQRETFLTKFFPITSITEFLELDEDGDTTETFDTLTSAEVLAGTYSSDDYYIFPAIGKVVMVSQGLDPDSRYKLTYTYGTSLVLTEVKLLCIYLTAMRDIVYFLGGQYNRCNSYQIPSATIDKGDIYARMKQQIEHFESEANKMYGIIGKKYSAYITAGGNA